MYFHCVTLFMILKYIIFQLKKIFNKKYFIRKNIFACLFSVHNTITLSRHEQVCLMRLRFIIYNFFHSNNFFI